MYLLYQAGGQLTVVWRTQSIPDYVARQRLGEADREKLLLVEAVKRYAVDSLGYLPVRSYTRIVDQNEQPALWALTASAPYALAPYYWRFPIVGRGSYKGFFSKRLALAEYNHLRANGWDVDMRRVSAWSTLGWFSDPLLSSMLQRSKASLAHLLFHELFHSTYYAPGSVDLNENLADFVAAKATQRFFGNDTAQLAGWLRQQKDQAVYSRYMLRQRQQLERFYQQVGNSRQRRLLKLRTLYRIADSVKWLPLHEPARYARRASQLLESGNAYFVDLQQYESLQDSLEFVFNKIYGGNLKIFIEHFKQNGINY